MTRKVAMSAWWRWAMRGLAALALIAVGILLFAQPLAHESLHFPDSDKTVIIGCSSPFDQIQAKVLWFSSDLQPFTESSPDTYLPRCEADASGREHIIEALSTGAIVLIALSFLRRRRRLSPAPSTA